MATLIGQDLGGYRIISQIGKGGMATVYKAFQPSLDRYVAVKVMPPFYAHEDETFVKRFKREAQSVAKLRHPNILLVIDFGDHDGLIYIVMEFVDAGTLTDRLGKPLPYDQTVKIIDQVASALDYAHMQGLVHRDVKPSNILLPKPDWPLLTDFGLAKIVGGSQLTITGTIAGTPAYMSPEQGQGESVDSRSDIYSLGIVLYEMMTGCVPYQAETPMAVVVKHIIEPLPLPSSKNPELPEAIERVILKALAKNPDDRYQRSSALAQALKDAVGIPKPLPSEKQTVVEDAGPEPVVTTVLEEPETGQQVIRDVTAVDKVVTEKPPPVAIPIDFSQTEPRPDIMPIPSEKPVKGLLAQRPWLKWAVPAGAFAVAICAVGLALVFLLGPQLGKGQGKPTEIVPTLTAEEHNTQGHNSFEAGDYDAAILEYEIAIDQGGKDPEMYFSLARAYKEVGRLEEALGAVDKVLRTYPEEAWVHESAGWFYQELSYHNEAITQFEIALDLNPEAVWVLEGMAESYRALGEHAKAEEILRQISKPEDGGDPYELENQGWEFLYSGDLDAAEDVFRRAVGLDPALVGAWDGLSEVALYRGDLRGAIDALITAVDFNPENADLHEKLGWLLLDDGDSYGAEDAFNKAIFLDSSLISAWEGLSEAYWYMDDLPKAIDVIETVIKSNPSDEALYEKLGWLYWDLGEYDPAIAALNEAIRIAPKTTYAYNTLSEIWVELEEDGQALAVLESALEANPDRPDIHSSLGYLFLEWGQYEDAIASFHQAINLDPENGWTYLDLAYAYRSLNRWDEATEAYNNAEKYSFEDPWLLEAVGWEYIELGNCERALAIFEHVLKLDPSNKGAREGIASCPG